MADDTTQPAPLVASGDSNRNDSLDAIRELIAKRKKQKGSTNRSAPQDRDIFQLVCNLLKASRYPTELSSLLAELPPEGVAEAVRKTWPDMSLESKDGLISGLFRQPAERAISRQIAIASRIAPIDGSHAIEILRGVVNRGSKGTEGPPMLSEEKANLLAKTFFLDTEAWLNLTSADDGAMKTVVVAFVRLSSRILSDPKASKNVASYRVWRDFVGWVVRSLPSLGTDISAKQSAFQQLRQIAKRLPDDWRKETEALIDAAERPVPLGPEQMVESQGAQPPLVTSTSRGAGISQGSSLDPAPSPEHKVSSEVIVVNADTSPDLIAKAERFIIARQAELESMTSLLNAFKVSHQTELELKLEIETNRQRLEGLESANASLHAQVTLSETAKREAELRAAISEERSLVADQELKRVSGELSEAIERIDREVSIRLGEFKAKLKARLHPVFDNKRTTDHQEPSPKLAEVLRHFFRQIEEDLAEVGISV